MTTLTEPLLFAYVVCELKWQQNKMKKF